MSMTRAEIKHAANAISHLYFHGEQKEERDALREELEATRSRKVETITPEEYRRRKDIELLREIRAMERGEVSICHGVIPSSSRSGTIPKTTGAKW